ncbi:hypothetical protein CLOM_g2868 [Closterium sp. NIES-68]|nr:hypothetical protein CLOM_g2868 [Closterium sp. NIES-68]GJP75765.1 hypothetical protein CLOP_g6168 [Closterium sp. NIES-67]
MKTVRQGRDAWQLWRKGKEGEGRLFLEPEKLWDDEADTEVEGDNGEEGYKATEGFRAASEEKQGRASAGDDWEERWQWGIFLSVCTMNKLGYSHSSWTVVSSFEDGMQILPVECKSSQWNGKPL